MIKSKKGNSPNNQVLIETDALSKSYQMGASTVHAVKDASIKIHKGEFVVLMGSSGSGKSTLMHLLGCLDTPTSGKYFLDKQDVSQLSKNQRALVRNQRIGFIFQTFNLISNLSALDNVALPLMYRKGQRNIASLAYEALIKMGIEKRSHHRPTELSGGERQRVAIARAIITEPAIILADEPTGNLDSKTGKDIIKSIVDLNKEGSTVLMVTHDPKVAKYGDRILHINDGEITKRSNNHASA